MIRHFDVFRNPVRAGRDDRPYVVNLQHRHFDDLRTRVVAPLVRERLIRPGTKLTPRVEVLDEALYLLPTELITLPATYLRQPIANIEEYRHRIVEAIDTMFWGA